MKIIISKNIADVRNRMTDENIIKLLFERIVLSNPRRCIINSKNEILIRNYGIGNKHNHWKKSNPIMTGFNRWQLISEATININKPNSSIIFKLDITLYMIVNIVLLLLFTIFPAIPLMNGSGGIFEVKLMTFIFFAFSTFSLIGILIKFLRHKRIIDNFVTEIKK